MRKFKRAAAALTCSTGALLAQGAGKVLYVDVVQPADSSGNPLPGRYPVLLTQTPYNKNAALNFENDYLVEHGYVQVIADVRGTGSSEGAWDSFGPREQQDGSELAGWTRSQSWSDGTATSGSAGCRSAGVRRPANPDGHHSTPAVTRFHACPHPICAIGGEADEGARRASRSPNWVPVRMTRYSGGSTS